MQENANFSEFIEMISWFLFFSLLMWLVYTTEWFADTEKSLYPWDKSHLIMVYGPFNVLLDLVCKFLLKILTSVSISGIGLYFSLWYLWFWYQGGDSHTE